MQNELDTLEQKLTQLLRLTRQLREENVKLRQDLANEISNNRRQQDKIDQTASRIEQLLSRIPEASS